MAEDRKFKFEDGHFVNRVSGEIVPDDEPVILFRARDKHALDALCRYWSRIEDPHHRQAVQERINEFGQFQVDHPERMKEPGITHHIELNKPSDDFRRGYSAGWDANNEYRADRRELGYATGAPSQSLMVAIMLTVFGGLFLAADIQNWVRWHAYDVPLWLMGIVPLTGALFLFRSRPKAKQKAALAQADFTKKWGNP